MKKWKDLVQKKWMVWACGPNVVYYVFSSKSGSRFKWETLDNHDDASDCLYFEDKKEVKTFINYCIAKNKIPKGCDRVEYCLVVPSYEDNKLWYEGAGKSYNRYLKVKEHE